MSNDTVFFCVNCLKKYTDFDTSGRDVCSHCNKTGTVVNYANLNEEIRKLAVRENNDHLETRNQYRGYKYIHKVSFRALFTESNLFIIDLKSEIPVDDKEVLNLIDEDLSGEILEHLIDYSFTENVVYTIGISLFFKNKKIDSLDDYGDNPIRIDSVTAVYGNLTNCDECDILFAVDYSGSVRIFGLSQFYYQEEGGNIKLFENNISIEDFQYKTLVCNSKSLFSKEFLKKLKAGTYRGRLIAGDKDNHKIINIKELVMEV